MFQSSSIGGIVVCSNIFAGLLTASAPRGALYGGESVVKRVVYIAVSPLLARLERSGDRMLGRVEVFRRVTIWRAVTAAYMAAFLAETQVHPTGADLETVFTTFGAGGDVTDRTNVFALLNKIHP